MKKLLQVGAGNIGRACVGRLFHDAGYAIYFSDVNQSLLALLKEKQQYSVRMVGQNIDHTQIIDNVSILPTDIAEKYELFATLDIITTAVGVPILSKIAPLIAEIITYRFQHNIQSSLNIIACENAVRASSQLKKMVLELLNQDCIAWAEAKIAFPDAATDSIVPSIISEDPLLVTSENFAEIIIEKEVFLGTLPNVEGLYLKDNLDAYIERKLFTLNTGHAITAYLGMEKGYKTVKEAISDLSIKSIVKAAMIESGNVLITRYGFDANEHYSYIDKIIGRFENPYLDDELQRVGRDPLRKLSRNDRLIKPILGAIEYNLPYDNLLLGVQAALQCKVDSDESSLAMQKLLKEPNGLQNITGLSIDIPKEKALLNLLS